MDVVRHFSNFSKIRWPQFMEKVNAEVVTDQCNAFHANPPTIKLYSDSVKVLVTSGENSVGAMFLNWNTFNVHHGGIYFGFSSTFQLMPTGRDGNAAFFSRMEPMNRESFKVFVDFLVKQNQLPQECDCDDFYELCGGIPKEART
jgi:hypothetical protein